MQVTPLCLMLSACLHVSPDRSQFSVYDTISMSCVDPLNSTGWKVKMRSLDGATRTCSSGWGSTSSAWTCIIGSTYPTDSGVYWCESVDRQLSNTVNITITDRAVILESPALAVLEGAAVTLHCKAQTKSSNHSFDFYKDGRLIRNSSATDHMTLHSVSKSDEGFYKCSISGGEESRASWLAVEASPIVKSACSVSVLRIVLHVLVGIPYLLSTIVLGLIYRDRRRAAAQAVAKRRGSNDVVMEIVV